MQRPPDPDTDLRQELRALRAAAGPHPAGEDLAAYHDGWLPGDEAEAVREHLTRCPECAELLLERAALDEPAAGDPPLSRLRTAAAWRRLRARRASRRKRRFGTSVAAARPAWAAAACLALVAAGLGLWGLEQDRTVRELSRPRINPPLVNLAPSTARTAPRPGGVARLTAGRARVWLILNPEAPLTASSYRVEVLDPAGESVLRLGGLEPSEAENFRLELPGDRLPPGRYRIVLSAPGDGGWAAIEEYGLEVTAP